jgi:hypothetical protein
MNADDTDQNELAAKKHIGRMREKRKLLGLLRFSVAN